MTSLGYITGNIKVLFKWIAIIIGALVGIFLLFRLAIIIRNVVNPAPPPSPTATYGILPQIVFPEQAQSTDLSYTINTISGTLPSFSDRINVYRMIVPSPNLLALQKASQKVLTNGFGSQPSPISATLYEWTSLDNLLSKKMDLDIVQQQFTVTSNYLTDPTILAAKNLPSENEALDTASSFLKNMSFYPDDIDEKRTKKTLFSIQDQTLIPASSFSVANIVKVSYYQKSVDGVAIYYPKPPDSTMSLLIGSGGYNGQVVAGDFFYQKVSTQSATYPIKTAQEALDDLETGHGYIAVPSQSRHVTIRAVSLGYYQDQSLQYFLMPIIVFEGDNDFLAYVSAIKDSWIQKTTE